MADPTAAAPASVAVYDGRPFFERALRHGVAMRILDAERLDAIRRDAPKGIVQIARYFGTEFLRPELERARERMVALIGLHLEDASGGDLDRAAQLLRDHSLLSRSKQGSDLLKALIVMPDSSHFGLAEDDAAFGERDDHLAQLARWSLRSIDDYRAERDRRQAARDRIDAACWFAARSDVSRDDLREAQVDAEAVIRTGLLAHAAAGRVQLPSWSRFAALVAQLRKRAAAGPLAPGLPAELPARFAPLARDLWAAMARDDLPRILDAAVTPKQLFTQTVSFLGRYHWADGDAGEIGDFDRAVSDQWAKLTQGHTDDSSLLTLFVCIAAGVPPKTALTETAAASLVRRLRKHGYDEEKPADFIREFAPHEHHNDYQRLWKQFAAETRRDLLDERDTKLFEALSALRLHCNLIAPAGKPAAPAKQVAPDAAPGARKPPAKKAAARAEPAAPAGGPPAKAPRAAAKKAPPTPAKKPAARGAPSS
jgi:hypothetical protein